MGGFKDNVGKLLGTVGGIAFFIVMISFSGCMRDQDGYSLGVSLLRDWFDTDETAQTQTSSPGPSIETYSNGDYGFSFKYPSPEFAALDDQSQVDDDSTVSGHDFVVVVGKPDEANNMAASSGMIIMVDDDQYLTKTDAYTTHGDVASMMAFEYNRTMKQAGFEGGVFHERRRVGNRKGYWQLVWGDSGSGVRVYNAYFVVTDQAAFTIIYSCPKDDQGDKWSAECDALIGSLRFN